MSDNKPKYPVQTVSKAIEIINYLAKDTSNRGAGITELSREIGMGKSTIHRILDTLLYYGYIDKNWETNRYRLGWELYSVGQRVPRQNQIFNLDPAYLTALSQKTGETVNFGILKGIETIIISKIEGNNGGLYVGVQAGQHEAVHATALGKILISEMDETEIRVLFANQPEFYRYTEHTIANVEELIEEVRRVRAAGYAVDNQEFGVGLVCVARAVRDYTGKIVAAVSVSTPANRMTEEHHAAIIDALGECSSAISWTLGYRPQESV